MVTIREVAKEAGVSSATVSRVINNSANVDSTKRDKVISTIERLGFRPNEVARSLFRKNSQSIGLLIPSITNPFFNQVAESVENVANQNGYKMILCNAHDNPEKEREYIENLLLRQIDGLVVVSDSNTLNEVIETVNIPIVAMDRYVFHDANNALKYPIVRTDNYLGGKMAGQHLIDCGCKKIAHVGRGYGSTIADFRAHGFADIMRKNDMDYVVITCPYDYNDGLEAAYKLFREYPGTDGIFAGNDLIAFAVITVSSQLGIKIPDKLQLVGYDDILFSRIITPSLTTVSQPIDLLGKTAAELLLKKIAGNNVPNEEVVLPVSLTIRSTTAVLQQNCEI